MAENCVHGIEFRFCAVCADPAILRELRRLNVKLRAQAQGARTAAERESLEAVYAYEEARSQLRMRGVNASRTWLMIERHGIIQAVERLVKRKDGTKALHMLVEMGMEDMAFENVVLRHPDWFSNDAVVASKQRLDRLRHDT